MRRGLRLLPYVDDFLVLSRPESALEERDYVQAVLNLLGLARQPSKGCWEPTQTLEHLGLGINTRRGIFYVAPERLQRISSAGRQLLCAAARNRALVPRKQLAAFTGLCQSVYLAVPPARHFLRSLHDCCAAGGKDWNSRVRLSSAARTDAQWFIDLPPSNNGRQIWRSPHSALLHTDASKLGWGAVLNWRSPVRGFWHPHQRRQHITMLEAKALRFAVEAFLPQLRSRHVLLREDNQAVCAMLQSWTSRSPALMQELRKLWYLLDSNDILLEPKYIRSEDNWWADELSRPLAFSEWQLSATVFRSLQAWWGPHSVDRFAAPSNALLPRFNSASDDAFAQDDWAWENNFCFPPIHLLPRLAQLLRESGAAATVVAPLWPAQPWFQQLQALASQFLNLGKVQQHLYCPGRLGAAVFAAQPRWSLAAFRIPAASECSPRGAARRR